LVPLHTREVPGSIPGAPTRLYRPTIGVAGITPRLCPPLDHAPSGRARRPARLRRAAPTGTGASAAQPDLRFLVGDLRDLPLATASLAGAVAFYSLIHFARDQDLRASCFDIARVRAPRREVIVAYLRGRRVVRPGVMWGTPVELEFRFLRPRGQKSLDRSGLRGTCNHPSHAVPPDLVRQPPVLPNRSSK
jgi:hypothetical protein